MQKPSGIDLTAALMGIFIILDLIAVFAVALPPEATAGTALDMQKIALGAKAIGLFVAVLEAVFLYFYWKGQNWARWLVMIDAVLILLSLFRVTKTLSYSHFAGGLTLTKAVFAVYLLYFLNTPAVKAWFAAPKTGLPPAGMVPPQYGA